jgi:hypothetical protein
MGAKKSSNKLGYSQNLTMGGCNEMLLFDIERFSFDHGSYG